MPADYCEPKTKADLDAYLRNILSLENVGRADEIPRTLYVRYTDEEVKKASALGHCEPYGIKIVWEKRK